VSQHLIEAVKQAGSAQGLLLATLALAQEATADAAPTLVEVLGFNNPGAAVAAVDGLIAIGEPAVGVLLELDPRNYGARAWAVRALAGIGDRRGLPVLIDALAHDVGPSVRRAAAKGLGQLHLDDLSESEQLPLREQCLDALVGACRDGEWVVRYAVAVGLEALALPLAAPNPQRQRASLALGGLAANPGDEVPVVQLRANLAVQRLS